MMKAEDSAPDENVSEVCVECRLSMVRNITGVEEEE
jgi:hypothetical protein